MAIHHAKHPFTRPKFSALPKKGHQPEDDREQIESLPDLIDFNAQHNPDHVFCLQASLSKDHNDDTAEMPAGFDGRPITFRELGVAVAACAAWLSGLRQMDHQGRPKPLALYLQSDVGLFLHLSALLSLDVPVLLLSARLAPASVQHLLEKTGCDTVLVSARTSPALAGCIGDHVRLQTVEPYTAFLDAAITSSNNRLITTTVHKQTRSNNSSLILHSSGTTGLPKPIVLSPRYPLLYAACHEFPADEHVDWTNLSTLPLYHGFGLLAPCLALSVGMTCCFPPSSIIPAGYSTLALMEAFDCRSLMTVPSIVGELLAIMPPNNHDGSNSSSSSSNSSSSLLLRRLRTLEFLAVGGGALAPDHGVRLVVGAGVRLINHYGVTEIGPLAPIFRPGGHEGDDDDNDYNWRYIRLRSDLDLQLRPAPGSSADDNHRCRLVGWPVGWGGEAFEIQDDLERNPDSPSGRVEVRILGRTDDVIVLKTGEKVLPQQLETALGALPSVQTAVCLGQGQFEVVVLVEPAAAARDVDMDDSDKDAFVSAVWEVVARVNPTLDRHACVTSKAAIIVKSPGKAVPRTDKGSVSRKMVHDVFADEMRAAYGVMENEAAGASLVAAGGDVASGIRRMALQVLARGGDDGDDDDIDADQDLFERGMDSLQALRLARLVKSAVTSLRPDRAAAAAGMASSADFIYRHPSIAKLTKAVQQLLVPDKKLTEEEVATRDDAEQQERSSYMRSLVATFTANMMSTAPPVHAQAPPRFVVLLTGATGALGVNVLASLVKRGHVSRVICVGRCHSATADADGPKKKNSAILARLRAAVLAAGISLEEHHWDKIETVEDRELLQSTTTITRPTTLSRLAAQVTHIVHMAWPMDFRRNLHSFGPHLRMLTTLLELGRRAYAVNPGRRRVRLSFVSSIATVEHYAGAGAGGGPTRVPERITDDPATAAPMGYAEAKWVCEHMTAFAADAWRDEMEAVVVRVGQLSGAEQNGGLWKTGEHIPALVNASRRIGAVPLLKGTVSWMPVDRAARVLVDILFHKDELKSAVLHLENPVRQPANDVMAMVAYELGLLGRGPGCLLPYAEWLRRARTTGCIDSLSDFFEHHFQRLALGDVVLDTTESRRISETLRRSSGLGRDLVAKYVRDWMPLFTDGLGQPHQCLSLQA